MHAQRCAVPPLPTHQEMHSISNWLHILVPRLGQQSNLPAARREFLGSADLVPVTCLCAFSRRGPSRYRNPAAGSSQQNQIFELESWTECREDTREALSGPEAEAAARFAQAAVSLKRQDAEDGAAVQVRAASLSSAF